MKLSSPLAELAIGIDVGGTFTDFVVSAGGEVTHTLKVPSTPREPERAVLDGLQTLAEMRREDLSRLFERVRRIVHGTTLATNMLLEGNIARTALFTTEGFRDLLEMREGTRSDRYNLRQSVPEPLVPRYLRFGMSERVGPCGTILRPLDEAAVSRLIGRLEELNVEAVAVAYLFSYLRPEHERRTVALLRERAPSIYVSASHEVLPRLGEYDRISTTVINAAVGPRVSTYLSSLEERLRGQGFRGELYIMQSNGGVLPARRAARLGSALVLSGPAGGVAGCIRLSGLMNEERLISFDMGGTSTDLSIIANGQVRYTRERHENHCRIALPAIDIHTLGAGGGSIASVDAGGFLRVGPRSAGAEPGPACYGRGGDRPTVTDAYLVLGILRPGKHHGKGIELNKGASEQAIREHIVSPLGVSVEEAALGIYRIATDKMAEGIRQVTVRQGIDPRGYSLLAFGGAGGAHAFALAAQLGLRGAFVPRTASVFSAFGLLVSDVRREHVTSINRALSELSAEDVRTRVAELTGAGGKELSAEGLGEDQIGFWLTAEMRYQGQVHVVDVSFELDGRKDLPDALRRAFEARYSTIFCHLQKGKEVVLENLRVAAAGRLEKPSLPELQERSPARPLGSWPVYFGQWVEAQAFDLEALAPGQRVEGPALLESETTTVVVPPRAAASVDRWGNTWVFAPEGFPGGRVS